MIRVWLWEEAPVELRGYPGLEEALAGKVPVWLAHRDEVEGDEADLFRGFVAAWSGRQGRAVYGKGTALGALMVGCLTDPPAPTEEART